MFRRLLFWLFLRLLVWLLIRLLKGLQALTTSTDAGCSARRPGDSALEVQQEKWLPHFSCLLFIAGCSTAGWGSRDILIVATVGFMLAVALWLLHTRQWLCLWCFGCAAFAAACWTDLLLLHAYWGLVLSVFALSAGEGRSGPVLAGTVFVLGCLNYFDIACWWFQPALLFAATGAAFALSLSPVCKSRSGCLRFSVLAACASACFALFGAADKSYGIKPVQLSSSTGDSFRFGGTASRIVGSHGVQMNVAVVGLGSPTAALVEPETDLDSPQIIVLEHDARSVFYGGRNLHQSLPWGAHTFFGNQYLAAAIERDGLLATNLGGSLSRDAGAPILMGCSFRHSSRMEALVAREGKRLVLSDSDVLADKLAAYNPAFIREMTGNNKQMRFVSLVFSLSAIAFLINQHRAMLIASAAAMVAMATFAHLPQVGDIRLCCETGSPHDASSAFAILRAINESSACLIRGQKQCRILCVGSGRKVRWAGEQLVILEPLAECRIGTTSVRCGNEPLGDLPDVPNAMQLQAGSASYRGKAEINGVVVIGSGSPAKQDALKWLSTAP